jgi:RNA polymerase sigma-70 factor (ECF subfamily)
MLCAGNALIPCEPPASDEALAAWAREGARSPFVTLVERYQDRVYRLALRISHNASDAEEIAQETFLLAHRNIASFQGESRFWTWLYRITVNSALMQLRAAKRHPVQSLEILREAGEDVLGAASDPSEGADELVHRKWLVGRVQAALAQLDDSQRVALVLHDLEGLSSSEAADLLGVSPDVVRQRAHRARLRLREELGDLLRVRAAH